MSRVRYTFETEYLVPPGNTFEIAAKNRYISCIKEILESGSGLLKTYIRAHGLSEIVGTGTSWDIFLQEVYALMSAKVQDSTFNEAREVAKSTRDYLLLATVLERQSYDPSPKGANNSSTVNNTQVNIFTVLESQGVNVSAKDILAAILGKPKEIVDEFPVEQSPTISLERRLTDFNLS